MSYAWLQVSDLELVLCPHKCKLCTSAGLTLLHHRLALPATGLPHLVIVAPSSPVAFATWEGANVDSFWAASQWTGSAAGMFLPFSPLFSEVQVW